jgi:hypothetical protein
MLATTDAAAATRDRNDIDLQHLFTSSGQTRTGDQSFLVLPLTVRRT